MLGTRSRKREPTDFGAGYLHSLQLGTSDIQFTDDAVRDCEIRHLGVA